MQIKISKGETRIILNPTECRKLADVRELFLRMARNIDPPEEAEHLQDSAEACLWAVQEFGPRDTAEEETTPSEAGQDATGDTSTA